MVLLNILIMSELFELLKECMQLIHKWQRLHEGLERSAAEGNPFPLLILLNRLKKEAPEEFHDRVHAIPHTYLPSAASLEWLAHHTEFLEGCFTASALFILFLHYPESCSSQSFVLLHRVEHFGYLKTHYSSSLYLFVRKSYSNCLWQRMKKGFQNLIGGHTVCCLTVDEKNLIASLLFYMEDVLEEGDLFDCN